MAKNEVFRSATQRSLPVGTGVQSGDPVRVGIINGVALTDSGDLVGTGTSPNQRSGIYTSNASGFATVWSQGVWNFTVVLAADRAAGTPIYSVPPSGNAKIVTLTDSAASGTNKLFGNLYLNSKSGTAVVPVEIIPTAV